MGRPKLVGEKKIVVSISCSIEDKEYLDSKGLSPTVFFQDALIKLRQGNKENSKSMEFASDIEQVRAEFVKSERGLVPKEAYWRAIAIFMNKWKDITKPEVIALVERPRYCTESKEDEKDETL